MAQQATHITYPEGPDALRQHQPDLYAAASEGRLARCRDQYAGPCAVPRETVRDKLERFIENDFHHLAVDVANMKGQLKILLIVVGVIAAATIGEFVAIVIQGVVR
jgi:hypothetical protein